MSRTSLVVLVIFAALEIATLGVLLVNLAALHQAAVARAIGPIHGAIYLTIVLIGLFAPGLRKTTRLLGIVPVFGGLLLLRDMRRAKDTTAR